MSIRITRKDGLTIPLTALVPKIAGRRVVQFDGSHVQQREQYKRNKKRGFV